MDIHVHIHHHTDPDITVRLDRLEQIMTSAAEQIDGVTTKVDDLIDDVRAALDILRGQAGKLDEAGQEALARLDAKVTAFDAEVGDANGSDTPPVEPGTPDA